jgi:hypothetical protein
MENVLKMEISYEIYAWKRGIEMVLDKKNKVLHLEIHLLTIFRVSTTI